MHKQGQIMRLSSVIALSCFPAFGSSRGKARNSTLVTQGESSTFSITRVFLGMNLHLVWRTKRFHTVHYSSVLLLQSDVLVSVSTVKFSQGLSWLSYVGSSRLSFSYILFLFLPLGSSAWFPCPHCLLCVCLLILQPACLLVVYLFSQEGT